MRSAVRVLMRQAARDVRYVRVPALGRAGDARAVVARQIERDFGVLAPPLALHAPAPAPFAAAWLILRESLLVEGHVARGVKEAVATEVSRANRCPYCVEVHEAAGAVLADSAAGAGEEIARWAREGWRRSPDDRRQVPFSVAEAPEMWAVAVTFHYLNRMVHLFLGDSPLPDPTPAFLRPRLLRTVAGAMRPDGPDALAAGASLDLLPAAPVPAQVRWAAAGPVLADAFGRSVAAVDDAAWWVADEVRSCLRSRLEKWDGTPPGLSRAWLDEAVGGLAPGHRAVGRLVLLTAFASYQVTDSDIEAFRAVHAQDRELIEVTSWAALTTAVHIGSRLALP